MIRLSGGWLAAVAKSRHVLQEVEAPLRDVQTESRVRAACSLVLTGWCVQEKGPLAARRGVWTGGRQLGNRPVSAGTQSGVPWGSAAPEETPFSPSSWAGGISGSDQKCVRNRVRAEGRPHLVTAL